MGAQRVRERRLGKMQMLEKQVAELKSDQKSLEAENRRLKMELMKLTGNSNVSEKQGPQRVHRQISNTEMPKHFAPPVEIKQECVNEVFQTVQPEESKILFTPGGTFVLTPLKQETVRFDFPEPETKTTLYHDSGEYNKVILNL